jgi:hypothetical protein
MALQTNKIGIHQFISLTGLIVPPATVKLVDDRPGVDGSEFVVTGHKGRPFSLISQVDEETYETAHNLLRVYQTAIDEDAVEIIQGGVSMDGLGFRVNVISVELAEPIRTIRGATGYRYYTTPLAFLICRWDLVSVPFED